MKGQPKPSSRAIAREIELLQTGTWLVSNAVSENDLLRRFRQSITGLIPHATLLLQRRDAGASHWIHLGDTPSHEPAELPTPSGHEHAVLAFERGRRSLRMSVRLQDGSLFGFALTRPLSAPPFTTTQFSALKILLQAYASSAQRLQSRLTEKSLLFSLNHRVLQLNSLIDTGIEVSKFNDAVRPEQLALERAASLTNSACGRVTVVSAGGEREVVNRHLHAQAVEKQRMERDMVLAAAIQQRILPMQLPAITGYDVAGVNIPSRSVGGDYYDCIALPDGRYAFVIADVAGKGIPAALLVSSFHAFLSAYLEASLPLHEFARRLNRVIRHAATEDKYVTAFFGLLTPETGHFHALNAGHNPVFVLRPDGAVR
ncbi:MAG: SpoIIE family protein phosphatase, partial [Bacteroidetes bacterium]|nr:SpoIIE family protein phosphatase [Bacteroidota bacterium]